MEHQPVAVVTGSSSGFGLWSSVYLAKAGFRVIATMRDLEKQDNLLQTAEEQGVRDRITIDCLDVTDIDPIPDQVHKWVEQFGRIDVLLNNAGYAAGGFTEELSMEDWRNQFETNFFGLVAVTRAVLPYMRKAGQGRIISMSSISGLVGFPGLAPYVSSKFAVEGFSESLRLEMKPFGIDVILIEPGSYGTDIWNKGLQMVEEMNSSSSPYRSWMHSIQQHLDKNRDHFGDPREVARLVVYTATVKKPRLRYPIGNGVKQGRFFKKIIPWTTWEKLVLRAILGKEKKSSLS
ncbi:MAG: SDR family oxidoreductase [Bacillaceae bacterium]|nr:SDR family oxidoreductase [Bacillaceae bacterium]